MQLNEIIQMSVKKNTGSQENSESIYVYTHIYQIINVS